MIECTLCSGSGKEYHFTIDWIAGHEEWMEDCSLCKGRCYISIFKAIYIFFKYKRFPRIIKKDNEIDVNEVPF